MSRALVIPADIRFPLERANGVQIVKTAAALARAGARSTLIVRRSDPRRTEEILAQLGIAPVADLTVRRLPVLHRAGLFAVPRLSFLLLASAASLAALARGAAVYTRDLQLAELLLRLRGPLPNRLVYEAHAVEALMYAERGELYGTRERAREGKVARLAAREGRVWRRAGAIVTTTAGIRDTFAARYGPRERVCVIPNGCDVPAQRTFVPPRGDGPPRIVYAGQLYPWKGVDILVEALAEVPGAQLVILGGLPGEADLERIRARVEALGLAGRTELRGTVAQPLVAEELGRATVVAVPFLKSAMTERHTSPIKAFEALAAGRPIVCTDLPSSREILEHERTALLVPPGDAPALAAAIRRLLDDRDLATRLARNAFDEAPRYSWDNRARRLLSFLEMWT
jgi:glycosyltransferase involved in cell wall biosynthesis